MNQCPRLVGIFAITTVVVFTFSYKSSPQLLSKEEEKELIRTLEDPSRGLGRRLQEEDFQKSHDLPRVDGVQAMGLNLKQEISLLYFDYVKSTKSIAKIKAEYEQCESQLHISQKRSEKIAETLEATKVILQALKEEKDDTDIYEDEEDY